MRKKRASYVALEDPDARAGVRVSAARARERARKRAKDARAFWRAAECARAQQRMMMRARHNGTPRRASAPLRARRAEQTVAHVIDFDFCFAPIIVFLCARAMRYAAARSSSVPNARRASVRGARFSPFLID